MSYLILIYLSTTWLPCPNGAHQSKCVSTGRMYCCENLKCIYNISCPDDINIQYCACPLNKEEEIILYNKKMNSRRKKRNNYNTRRDIIIKDESNIFIKILLAPYNIIIYLLSIILNLFLCFTWICNETMPTIFAITYIQWIIKRRVNIKKYIITNSKYLYLLMFQRPTKSKQRE